jgi:VanZ family protein
MGDKAGHFFLIGSLAYLFNRARAWRAVTLGCWRVQWGGLIILVLITLEECSQVWIPQRSFDLKDLLANYAGILAAQVCSRSAPPAEGPSA